MSRLFRLTTTRECRVLTPTGWGALLMVFCLVITLTTLFVYSFLAPTKPVGGEILVVEGWLPDYALEQAKEQFQIGNYRLLVTIGGKIVTGSYLSKYETWAQISASTLKELGFPEDKIMTVPVFKNIKKNRTYHGILALKSKLYEEGLNEVSIDLVSLGAHSRRSWILFEKVFPSLNIGIIAITPEGYNISRWWLSSEGVREVISESIAYLYARFIFSPPIKN